MGFNKVYNCLVDVFPQVDQRILKAVAIENSKDADAAVEVVLTEILPALPVKPVAVAATSNSSSPLIQSDEEVKHARNDEVSRGKQVSECGASSSSTEHMKSGEIVVDASVTIDAFDSESFVAPQTPAVSTVNVMSLTQNDASGYTESDELILFGKTKEPGTGASTDDISIVKLNNSLHEALNPVHVISTDEFNLVVGQDKVMGNPVETASKNRLSLLLDLLNVPSNHDFEGSDQPADLCGTQASGSMPQVDDVVHQSAELTSVSGLHAEQVLPGVNDTSNHDFGGSDQPADLFGTQASGSILQVDNVLHQSAELTSDSGCLAERVISDERENLDNSLDLVVDATRSSQICRIDVLEEIIEDARNNKKILLRGVQSVLNMVAEVELQEKAAEKAKEEAAKAGLDTLSKVEELVQILTHAKEANDMHAGEIYGEKAILATEAKELQSRLHTLSEERDTSLAILDEMWKTLEERHIAAEEARKAAEQDILEKEESARKVLAEQEAMMERVVEESKVIQQEAEENAKLRDFLMDRGQVVDSLQGEISVICEDVRLLKEKFDQRLPLSKSISSSQTSCILASSGSSLRSTCTSSAFIGEQHSENAVCRGSSRASSFSAQSVESESADGVCVERRDLLENGLESWDLVENEGEML